MAGEVVVADLVPEPNRPGKLGRGRPSKRSLQAAQKSLNDNQLRFAVWLSMPEKLRRPETRRELAAELGVTEMTLYRWSKSPDVVMATRWLQLQNAGDVGRVSNVLDFLYETTQDLDAGLRHRLDAAKQWLQAVGVHEAWKYDNELLKVKQVEDFDLDSLSDEELWELYNSRANELRAAQEGGEFGGA